MRNVVLVLLFCALLAPASARAGERGYGFWRSPNGVGAVATYSHRTIDATPVQDLSSTSIPSSIAASQSLVDIDPTNRCTATNLGEGFSYSFANGVECASFSAPVPGEAVRRNGRRPRPPSAAQIAAALFDRTIALAPEPQLEVAPSRIGLTGLRTFVWLDESPRPIVATASAGATTVTAVATPARFVWDFGEGQVRSTSHSGTRWTPRQRGSVGHMYQASGRYDLSVDIMWSAQWRSGTGPWQPLGTFSTSDSRPYAVREVIAWLARRR